MPLIGLIGAVAEFAARESENVLPPPMASPTRGSLAAELITPVHCTL